MEKAVTRQSIVFLVAVLIFVAFLVTAYTVYLRRARRVFRDDDVAALLKRLTFVDRYKLAQVAQSLNASGAEDEPASLDSWQVWELTGGLDGLQAMAANCDVLIELACHVQQWYPEALTVAEELRLNAREIHWHLDRLRAAEQHGHQGNAYPEYAQQASVIYCRMTRNLLHLYEAAGLSSFSQVQATL